MKSLFQVHVFEITCIFQIIYSVIVIFLFLVCTRYTHIKFVVTEMYITDLEKKIEVVDLGFSLIFQVMDWFYKKKEPYAYGDKIYLDINEHLQICRTFSSLNRHIHTSPTIRKSWHDDKISGKSLVNRHIYFTDIHMFSV